MMMIYYNNDCFITEQRCTQSRFLLSPCTGHHKKVMETISTGTFSRHEWHSQGKVLVVLHNLVQSGNHGTNGVIRKVVAIITGQSAHQLSDCIFSWKSLNKIGAILWASIPASNIFLLLRLHSQQTHRCPPPHQNKCGQLQMLVTNALDSSP